MTIPASLSKLKSLFPVVVVGSSVLITIKLLTESTPLTSEILQVKAEEDIKTVDYKDELVEIKEPEPQPEPPTEQSPPSEEQKDNQENEEEPKKDDKSVEDDKSKVDSKEDNQENQKKDQSEQKPKPPGRAFISGGIGDILKEIMKSSKK